MMCCPSGVIAECRDVIYVSYHLFLLAEEGYHPGGAIPEATNGLVDGGVDCAFIRTGIHTGYVSLTVQTRDRLPSSLDLDWDEVAEVTLRASVGNIRVASLMDDVPDAYPRLTPKGPGDYRLRVQARGRDTDIDGTAFEPFEEYLIQIWPAPAAPQEVFKTTDRYGAELRLHASREAR